MAARSRRRTSASRCCSTPPCPATRRRSGPIGRRSRGPLRTSSGNTWAGRPTRSAYARRWPTALGSPWTTPRCWPWGIGHASRARASRPARRRSFTSSRRSFCEARLALVRQDERAGGGEHAAHAVDERALGLRDLARAALAPELARRLDDREDAVHAAVGVGEPAAVGVDRELAAGGRAPLREEVHALAPLGNAERLEHEGRARGEGVVEHDVVEVRALR